MSTRLSINQMVLSVLTVALMAIAVMSGCGGSGSRSSSGPPSETSISAPPDAAVMGSNAAAIRYLSLGDSLTHGVESVDEQTAAFPALLSERWRTDGCRVELRNVGVSGYTAELATAIPAPCRGS